MNGDDRLTSPAVARNRGPILDVLRRVLPEQGLVLEVASGTGEHALFFAHALSNLTWQPTDADPANLRSIAAWSASGQSANLLPPLLLDAAEPAAWKQRLADAILAINLIHIAPWRVAEGLFAGAASVLPPGGPLILYGPYRDGDRQTAESNAAFDADLKARNPEWGLRDLGDVARLGAVYRFGLQERIEMPANNLILIFSKHSVGREMLR